MIKHLPIWIILGISIGWVTAQPLYSQESHQGMMFGVEFSPDYSYRYAMSNQNPKYVVLAKNDSEWSDWRYSLGIFTRSETGRKIEYELGLQFSRQGYESHISVTNLPGYPVGKGYIDVIFNYIKIPLILHFRTPTIRSEIYFTSGVSADFLVYDDEIVHITYIDGRTITYGTTHRNDNLNKFIITAIGGVGYSFKILKSFRMYLEPTFRIALIPNEPKRTLEYNYSFGFQAGIARRMYRFNKSN